MRIVSETEAWVLERGMKSGNKDRGTSVMVRFHQWNMFRILRV